MRGSVLAWGARCATLGLAASLGCGLVESTAGLSGGGGGADAAAADVAGDDSTAVDAGMEALPDVPGEAVGPFDAAQGDADAEASTPDATHDAAEAGPEGSSGDAVAEAPVDVVEEPVLGPIAFVQIAVTTPPSFSSSVQLAFTKAQAKGDLNVVAVGWNDATSAVSGVTDSAGNTYSLAVGPTTLAPDLTQAIYYAPGVAAAAAGANTVTVAFVQPANVVDLRIVEYSGLSATAPLDTVGLATGTSAGPASAAVTTATARELVFAAGMSTDLYSAAGAGFTMRIVTSDGDMAEDRIVSSAGAYTAQATLGTSCGWIMQVATFR